MTARSYSVAEIDRMRNAIWQRCTQPSMGPDYDMNVHRLSLRIEDNIRTYMAGGADPDDICGSSK